MSNTIEMSFTTSKKILSVLGEYPSENDSNFSKVKKFALYIIFLVFPAILVIKRILLEEISDNQEKTFLIMYSSQIVCFVFKLMPFLKNGLPLKSCVTFFEHSRFTPLGEEEKKIAEECVNMCRKITTGYSLFLMVAIIVIFTKAVLTGHLPLYQWTTCSPTAYSLQYWLITNIQLTVLLYQVYSSLTIDAIIGGLLYHAAGQSRILKHNFEYLATPVKQYKDNQDEYYVINYEDIDKDLKRCIERHVSIINFVAEFEECFSWPMFYQLSGSMFALCFSFIGFLVASNGSDKIIFMLSFIATMLQLFFYCFFGTLLKDEVSTLNDAIYMGDWCQYDVRTRKTLITVMERAKRPMIITAGKVIPLTLDTFVSVLKTSYSMVAIFKDYSLNFDNF